MANETTVKVYEITREFTGGILKGLTHTSRVTAPVAVGTVVKKPVGNTSPYRIVSCEFIGETTVKAYIAGQFAERKSI